MNSDSYSLFFLQRSIKRNIFIEVSFLTLEYYYWKVNIIIKTERAVIRWQLRNPRKDSCLSHGNYMIVISTSDCFHVLSYLDRKSSENKKIPRWWGCAWQENHCSHLFHRCMVSTIQPPGIISSDRDLKNAVKSFSNWFKYALWTPGGLVFAR